MSRELQRIGAPFRQPEWSALALIEAPEMVRKAHANFVAAGAQVITTNSYALVPFHVGEARFVVDGAWLADLAGRMAREAAEPGVTVAGSLPPVFGSYRPDLFRADEAQALLSVLVAGLAPHIDVFLAETQSAIAELRAAAEAVAPTVKPLWVSFTLRDGADVGPQDPARLRSGEDVSEAVRVALELGVQAVLFNCSRPEVMEAALDAARSVSATLPLGVYANAFDKSQDEDGDANETVSILRDDLDPAHYSDWAQRWQAKGATILGGCCGIGTNHIHHLATHLKG